MTLSPFRFWHGLSLAGRLLLVLLLCTSLSTLWLLFQQLATESRNYSDSLVRKTHDEISSLAPQVADQALIGDYTAIQQILDRFAGHAYVEETLWTDAKGIRLISHTDKPPAKIPGLISRIMDMREIVEAMPLVIGGHSYGSVSLRLDPSEIQEQLWRNLLQSALGLALSWLLQAGLILVVLRHSIAPLTDMNEAVRRMETGDLSARLYPSGSPEVRHLMVGFNAMAQAMENATHQSGRNLAETETARADMARFSEILTHHMQEPVRQIVAFAQILQKCGGNDPESLGFIIDAARRQRSLLADIELYLALSHLPLATATASSLDAAKTALADLAPQLTACGGHITMGNLPMVWLDRQRMVLLFKELFGNAIEYRSPDRPLEVTVNAEPSDQGGFVRLSVADNGIGIDRQYFDMIFDVFRRLHTRDVHPGNGIGLAAVRKIVTMAGGEIGLESTLGQGTGFSFTLPLRNPDNGAS